MSDIDTTSALRRLFDLACDLPAAQREAALRAAGADAAMVREVLSLIAADADTRTRSRTGVRAMLAQFGETELHPGDTLGAWRLLSEIGHGGMGAVLLAERADGHFTQHAAVKLIRGLADADAATRFARERQTLANLQHPQIARLLDGGATPGGAPYLVMEHIEGVPLDRWCAEAKPGLDERLRLFVSICKALQFAHQRLIVHCDLKPSNVLVRADSVPVLLDFGIAQALDRSEEGTALADYRFHTPRYASPEQARGETPTIQSDVFSLGALLYELTSDQPPPLREDAARATLPVPSATATPELLWRGRLKGDIDAIVARACASDPARRYASALALADDIERIAAHRPVLARSPTFAYVGARLLRRRWPAFAVGALVLAMAAGFTWRTVLAEHEARQQAAISDRVAEFLVSVFNASDSNLNDRASHDLTAREVLDNGTARIEKELAATPQIQARLFEAVGNAYRHMNANNKGARLLRRAADLYLSPAVDQPLAGARCLSDLANTMANGEFPSSATERAARDSLALSEHLTPPGSQSIANAWMVLSLALNRGGNYAGAQSAAETSLEMNRKTRGGADNRYAPALHNLCLITSNRGDQTAALKYCEQSIAVEPEQVLVGQIMHFSRYALAQERAGDYARAIATSEQVVADTRKVYGDLSDFGAVFTLRLAKALNSAGRYSEALDRARQALADELKLNGENSGEYTNVLLEIGRGYMLTGEWMRALPELRRVLDYRLQHYDASDPMVLIAKTSLASTLIAQGHADAQTRTLLDEARTGWSSKDDAGTVDPPYTVLALAQWHASNADTDAALDLLQQLDAPAAADGFVRSQAAALRAELARRRGDDATALADEERAWKILRDAAGARHPQTARFGLIYARGLRAADQATQADTLEKELRPIFETAFPADSAFRRE